MSDARWKLWRVALRVRSPIHAGYRKLGNVQMTRPYVTGKTIWGALTANLTRALHPAAEGAAYEEMGEKVNTLLAFSYFYPSIHCDSVKLWPWEDPDRFAWLYLSSYASTALEYSRFGALDGSLHETECIRPYTPEGKPVFLVGYVAEDTRAKPWCWRKVLRHCQIGGKRSYGWGRVEVQNQDATHSTLFGLKVDPKGERPEVILDGEKERALLAHTLVEGLDANGLIEPLVGREWHNSKQGSGRGPGQDLKNRGICYAPGSTVRQDVKFSIGSYGIWRNPTPARI